MHDIPCEAFFQMLMPVHDSDMTNMIIFVFPIWPPAAILDFSVTKYVDCQIHNIVRFLDPKNVGKDTKIISLAHFLKKLLMIS